MVPACQSAPMKEAASSHPMSTSGTVVPANTLASFDMAREIGVDIVEFDVRCWRGELVLAHTRFDAPRPWNLRLHEALEGGPVAIDRRLDELVRLLLADFLWGVRQIADE